MHRATRRKAPEVSPVVFAGERLRGYADRIRRATAMGHRLNFTAEEVLEAVQQASRHCMGALEVPTSTDTDKQKTIKDVAGVQEQIYDTIQALRERMLFAPL
ncbi:hypothetical protein [Tardiphaga sp. OK245]|uniref:hypothetical protein n=1 Tax=Tardiphaga sp. OK245 TaxID=1855306 RepID=UPI0008A8117D|nr:hypothetical protein [Tardiphaga sp. OK245]SEI19533.1 hypothetical protein SAMN05216367_4890 [Tardiphaga sp. OK245]